MITKTDDGVRVTVNGKTLIDKMNGSGLQENREKIYLEQGKKYDIKVEHRVAGYLTIQKLNELYRK